MWRRREGSQYLRDSESLGDPELRKGGVRYKRGARLGMQAKCEQDFVEVGRDVADSDEDRVRRRQVAGQGRERSRRVGLGNDGGRRGGGRDAVVGAGKVESGTGNKTLENSLLRLPEKVRHIQPGIQLGKISVEMRTDIPLNTLARARRCRLAGNDRIDRGEAPLVRQSKGD